MKRKELNNGSEEDGGGDPERGILRALDEDLPHIFPGTSLRADDPELLSRLDAICKGLLRKYKVPAELLSWQDLSQTVFLKYWSALKEYRGDAAVETVIYKIARNEVVDFWRRMKHYDVKDSQASKENADDDFSASLKERQQAKAFRQSNFNFVAELNDRHVLLSELVAVLTPAELALVRERFEFGKTATEIAEERGVKRQAVSKRLIRIQRKLRSALDRRLVFPMIDKSKPVFGQHP